MAALTTIADAGRLKRTTTTAATMPPSLRLVLALCAASQALKPEFLKAPQPSRREILKAPLALATVAALPAVGADTKTKRASQCSVLGG